MASITQAACTEQRAAADIDLPSDSLLSSVQPQQPAMLPLASVLPSRDPESSGGAPATAMSTRRSQDGPSRSRGKHACDGASALIKSAICYNRRFEYADGCPDQYVYH